MVVTQSDEIAMRVLRVHGGMKTYYHEEVGCNSASTRWAAFCRQMVSLASWSAARRRNAAYRDGRCGFDDVRTPTIDSANESI
jgi:dTDP-4-amino-4,6-dideoxygalactose transaminase